MNDFAKLFKVEGIGQILATLNENEDGMPCVTFRIPDTQDIMLECSVYMSTDDYEKAEAHAIAVFNALDEASAVKTVQELVDARDSFQAAQ